MNYLEAVTQPNCRPLESTIYEGHGTGYKGITLPEIHVSPNCRDGSSETRLIVPPLAV